MKIFLLIFLFLFFELNAQSFFIVGEQHDSHLAKYVEGKLRAYQKENKIKYFRESHPTQLKPDDVFLDDPHLVLYVEIMRDVLFNEDRSLLPKTIYNTLNDYREHLNPKILSEIQKLFGKDFGNLFDFAMGNTSKYFLERLKKFWVPLEKIKTILKTYVIKVLEEKFQAKCDWDEFGLVTFRNHAWLSNLEPHLEEENGKLLNGKYVIQMGRRHVEHFSLILKKKYPLAKIETFKLQDDIDEDQKDPTQLIDSGKQFLEVLHKFLA